MSAEAEFNKLVEYIEKIHGGESGQMFGKKCIKINGKAGIALFKDCIVFKLPESHPKEWRQVPMKHKGNFKELAKAAAEYVG